VLAPPPDARTRVELLDVVDGPTRDAWRELAVAEGNPFATPEWHDAWREVHPEDGSRVGVARADGAVVGVLPLVSTRRRGARVLTPPGAVAADFTGAPCRPGRGLELAERWGRALADVGRSWDAVAIDRMVDARAWGSRVRAGAEGVSVRLVAPEREVVLPFIDLSDGFDGWLATRSRRFRKRLPYLRRRLEREHRVVFSCTQSADDLPHDLSTLFELHGRRWAARGLPSGFSDLRALHEAFASRALRHGWLRLWTLAVDDRPVAAWYGFRCGERYCFYQSGFDPDHAEHQPGTVLLAHTVEQAAAEGARVFDLLGGQEGYKDRFGTGRRTAEAVLLVRLRSPAGAALAAEARARRLVRRLPPRVVAPLRLLASRGRR
jgi:CelD/BcsL family acetyltransferase involved in cellulose biosynthesis